MKAVTKIIEINFKFSPLVITTDDLNNISADFYPKLLIIDKTVLNGDFKNDIRNLMLKFNNSKIIIITLEDEERLESEFKISEDIEIINLWQRQISLIEYLISNIRKKIKKIEVLT